jgi:1-acyl-sn-glycerol-3-phosphate acyltransferase
MQKMTPILYDIVRDGLWLLAKLLGRAKVIGREHVPRTGSVLLAANHTSYADPPLVGGAARPRRAYFMAKSELFAIPLLGPLLPRIGAFPVHRGSADRQALRTAHEVLTSGDILAIFYEGGRSPDGRLMPPELGPAMIALRAGVPVVPVAVINADKFLPLHSALPKLSHVTVIFGAPLTFPHLAGKASDREAVKEVGRAIACAVADLMRAHGAADRVPDGYPDVPRPSTEEGEA